jgi:hypothetical protein
VATFLRDAVPHGADLFDFFFKNLLPIYPIGRHWLLHARRRRVLALLSPILLEGLGQFLRPRLRYKGQFPGTVLLVSRSGALGIPVLCATLTGPSLPPMLAGDDA